MSGAQGTTIDKRDAARRQLDEAIRLWLEDRDRLAVHTLTMAAFGILNPLAEKTAGARHKEFMESFLSDYGYAQFYALANYLKHADRDAGVSIQEPIDEENEWRIGLFLAIFRELSGSLTPVIPACANRDSCRYGCAAPGLAGGFLLSFLGTSKNAGIGVTSGGKWFACHG